MSLADLRVIQAEKADFRNRGQRRHEHAELLDRIVEIHRLSRPSYGSLRIHEEAGARRGPADREQAHRAGSCASTASSGSTSGAGDALCETMTRRYSATWNAPTTAVEGRSDRDIELGAGPGVAVARDQVVPSPRSTGRQARTDRRRPPQRRPRQHLRPGPRNRLPATGSAHHRSVPPILSTIAATVPVAALVGLGRRRRRHRRPAGDA